MADRLQRVQFRNNRLVEEFVPSSGWTEVSNCHLLLVDLPEFKMEEVTLQAIDNERMRVSGERLVNNNKCVYFEKTFSIPKDSDTTKITRKFEGDTFSITIPKKAAQPEEKHEEIKPENEKVDDKIRDKNEERVIAELEKPPNSKDSKETEQGKPKRKKKKKCCLKKILEKKEILLAVLLAFSLGAVSLSQKFPKAGR